MFDRTTILAPRAPSSTYVHVTEKRAPTDESVRLLKEFEEKAAAKVRSAVSVNTGLFDCVIQEEMDFPSDTLKVRAVFSLNDQKMEAQVQRRGYEPDDPQKLATDLRDAMATKIASHIISESLTKALGRRF